MLLSVSSNLFSSSGDPEDSLRRIAEIGFTHIMWGHHWNTDFAYGRYELAAIRKMLRRYGLDPLQRRAGEFQRPPRRQVPWPARDRQAVRSLS